VTKIAALKHGPLFERVFEYDGCNGMKIVTTKELAEAFNVTVATISNWRDMGMPILTKRNTWDLHACLIWKIQTEVEKKTKTLTDSSVTEAQWEMRKTAAMAQLKEYELDEIRNDVVRHKAVEDILTGYLEPLRVILLQIPSTWALEILGIDKKEEAQMLLRKLVDELLLKASAPVQLPDFAMFDQIEKKLEKEGKDEK